MRIAFISDLHGNVPALEAVFADIDAVGADEVICLGDIVDLGPEPSAVIAMLRARGVPCIQGNHDPLDEHPPYYLLKDIEDFSARVLSDDDRAWLAALPLTLEREAFGCRLLAVHGSPRSDVENMDPSATTNQLREMLAGVLHDVVVAGHTHVPMVRRVDDQLVVNVGSVGLAFQNAFDGTTPTCLPYAEYGVVTLSERGVSAEIRRVAYDMLAYARAVHDRQMPHGDEWLSHWTT